jgi:peroxiredoxin Q/BCP
MALTVGTPAPPFEAEAHDGRVVRMADLVGKRRVVLFFYPKDFSFFCTREACGLRDVSLEAFARDTTFVGISRDSVERHRAFAQTHKLVFPLVSDASCRLGSLYQATSVIRSALGMLSRVTYVIDRRGLIQGVIEGDLTAKRHVDGVRELLPRLP